MFVNIEVVLREKMVSVYEGHELPTTKTETPMTIALGT